MRILVAEDDALYRAMFQRLLSPEYEPTFAEDGIAAWKLLQLEDAPQLVILDWLMPGMNGVDVCSKLRAIPEKEALYILMATAKQDIDDVLMAFDAGANDYITKPFNALELKARLNAGRRVIELQAVLALRVQELQEALSRVKLLRGLLPICSYCKRIRDDRDYWQQRETYMGDHSEATFTHGICPECYEKITEPELERLENSPL